MNSTPSNPSRPRWYSPRRWARFSLRSLLVLVTLICLVLGWLAYERNEYEAERVALAALDEDSLGCVLDGMEQPVFRGYPSDHAIACALCWLERQRGIAEREGASGRTHHYTPFELEKAARCCIHQRRSAPRCLQDSAVRIGYPVFLRASEIFLAGNWERSLDDEQRLDRLLTCLKQLHRVRLVEVRGSLAERPEVLERLKAALPGARIVTFDEYQIYKELCTNSRFSDSNALPLDESKF